MIDSPVIDPFAKRIRIEDAAQKDDRWFSRIPIFDRIPRRYTGSLRIGFRSFGVQLGISGFDVPRCASCGQGMVRSRSLGLLIIGLILFEKY